MITNYKAPIGKGLHIVNTGDYRTFYPEINHETCVRCGNCLIYCPVNAIKKEDNMMKIDMGYCKGCGVCAYECPTNSISMIEEEVENNE